MASRFCRRTYRILWSLWIDPCRRTYEVHSPPPNLHAALQLRLRVIDRRLFFWTIGPRCLSPPLRVASPTHPSVPAVVSSLIPPAAGGKASEKRVPAPAAGVLSWSQVVSSPLGRNSNGLLGDASLDKIKTLVGGLGGFRRGAVAIVASTMKTLSGG
ncbi:hypothetical protein BHE74_00002686 [Ensete ventricosum]|nr:hypothetical protein BHE74_00002686 [Ensete ventricosum]RZS03334.1 hypothetical protein BHM03_00033509 [Ensete ventricosum]